MKNNEDITYQVLMASSTVAELVDQIDKRKLLIAPFQRTYQWHKDGNDSPRIYLDSLNRNIFTMPVIFVEHENKTWIIDGQQRLATLYCYVKGVVPKANEIKWDILIKAIKNKDLGVVEPCQWEEWDDLDFNMDKIKQAPIGYSLLFNVNHQDDNKLLVQIFDRINNQGIKLDLKDTIRAYLLLNKKTKPLIDILDKFSVFKTKYAIYVDHNLLDLSFYEIFQDFIIANNLQIENKKRLKNIDNIILFVKQECFSKALKLAFTSSASGSGSYKPGYQIEPFYGGRDIKIAIEKLVTDDNFFAKNYKALVYIIDSQPKITSFIPKEFQEYTIQKHDEYSYYSIICHIMRITLILNYQINNELPQTNDHLEKNFELVKNIYNYKHETSYVW